LLVVEKASVEEKGNRPLMTRRSNVTHSSFASGAVPSVKASVWYANAMEAAGDRCGRSRRAAA
jgi:hypothetical protein